MHRVDVQADRWGWDRPPRLLLLTDERDVEGAKVFRMLPTGGSTCSAGPYLARTWVPDAMFSRYPAGVAVRRLALRFTTTDPVARIAVETMLGVLRQRGLVGMALICEGWWKPMTQAEADRYMRGGQLIADMPDRKECRMIDVVTIDGQAHYLMRVRGGSDPEVFSDDALHEGAVVESLRTLMAVIDGRTPQPMQYQPVVP